HLHSLDVRVVVGIGDVYGLREVVVEQEWTEDAHANVSDGTGDGCGANERRSDERNVRNERRNGEHENGEGRTERSLQTSFRDGTENSEDLLGEVELVAESETEGGGGSESDANSDDGETREEDSPGERDKVELCSEEEEDERLGEDLP
ncbi:hypothetical protein PFISCL1PPCAC_26587, partial [Pristionchus fissidentatus]